MRQDTKEKNLSNFETFGEDVIETVICQVFTGSGIGCRFSTTCLPSHILTLVFPLFVYQR